MPTYDYACTGCGQEFEAFHSMNSTLEKCPLCGASAPKRKLGTGAGLIFKGSGFYQTDYKPKPAQNTGSSEGKPSTSDSSSSASSTE